MRHERQAKAIFALLLILIALEAKSEDSYRVYHIENGDVLGVISKKLYGTARKWHSFLPINPDIKNPDLILSGHDLKYDPNGAVTTDVAPETGQSVEVVKPEVAQPQPIEAKVPDAPATKTSSPFDGSHGPFAYRKSFGAWIQPGFGALTQSIKNPKYSATSLDVKQGMLHLTAGLWKNHFVSKAGFRQKIFDFGTVKPSAQWLNLDLGYGVELLDSKNLAIFLVPYVGFEGYRNTIAHSTASGLYIKSYTAPTLGFSSRFIFHTRYDLGGDFAYAILSHSTKFFIQGDFRYWLTERLAWGGGYWVDKASIKNAAGDFNEMSFAIETYLRYVF